MVVYLYLWRCFCECAFFPIPLQRRVFSLWERWGESWEAGMEEVRFSLRQRSLGLAHPLHCLYWRGVATVSTMLTHNWVKNIRGESNQPPKVAATTENIASDTQLFDMFNVLSLVLNTELMVQDPIIMNSHKRKAVTVLSSSIFNCLWQEKWLLFLCYMTPFPFPNGKCDFDPVRQPCSGNSLNDCSPHL